MGILYFNNYWFKTFLELYDDYMSVNKKIFEYSNNSIF